MQTDLYQVLGVDPGASAEELRRAYRAKAFELHPDRHGGSPAAAEGFKELTAAYAVLGDAGRRSQYDAARARGTPWGQHPGDDGGPQADPAELFRNMFRDPTTRRTFEQLAREFSRQGLRFDEAYLKKVFSGGRGPVVFGGVFFAGSLGSLLGSLLSRATGRSPAPGPRAAPAHRPGRLRRLFGRALPAPATATAPGPPHQTYVLPVPAQTLADGGRVTLSLPGDGAPRTYQVQVPPGSHAGTRLRLGGQGGTADGVRGDLLLELRRAG